MRCMNFEVCLVKSHILNNMISHQCLRNDEMALRNSCLEIFYEYPLFSVSTSFGNSLNTYSNWLKFFMNHIPSWSFVFLCLAWYVKGERLTFLWALLMRMTIKKINPCSYCATYFIYYFLISTIQDLCFLDLSYSK